MMTEDCQVQELLITKTYFKAFYIWLCLYYDANVCPDSSRTEGCFTKLQHEVTSLHANHLVLSSYRIQIYKYINYGFMQTNLFSYIDLTKIRDI